MAALLVSLGLRAPPPDPAEQMKEWQKEIKKQIRRLDRDIEALTREEKKHVAECKKMAARDRKAMMITAKSIVQSRKAKEKMYISRATMNTMQMQIATQASMLKVAGAMGKSTEVMRSLNQLMKVGKMSEDMQALAREMTKAGLVEEMMSEAMDEGMGDDVEEEAADEVHKILMEVVPDMPDAPWAKVAARPGAAAEPEVAPAAESAEDAAMAALQARADAL
jgi:charged multivesicular body protein 3